MVIDKHSISWYSKMYLTECCEKNNYKKRQKCQTVTTLKDIQLWIFYSFKFTESNLL